MLIRIASTAGLFVGSFLLVSTLISHPNIVKSNETEQPFEDLLSETELLTSEIDNMFSEINTDLKHIDEVLTRIESKLQLRSEAKKQSRTP
jgi:hypothetical protein